MSQDVSCHKRTKQDTSTPPKPSQTFETFNVPSMSGKSGVRHMLQEYDTTGRCFTTVTSNLMLPNGTNPSCVQDISAVIEDGSVTLMHVAHSLPPTLIWLSSWDVFWKLSHQLRIWGEHTSLVAYVLAFDKPSKDLLCPVPERKKDEQQRRDAQLFKTHVKLATQLLSEGEKSHEQRSHDPKAVLWHDLKKRLSLFCDGEDPSILFADLLQDAFSDGEGITLPSVLWRILIADRRSRQVVLRHFVVDLSAWTKLATVGGSKCKLYIDWNDGERYNSIGEADGSWAAWLPMLQKHHTIKGLMLLTVDTDVALLALLWRSCHYDGTHLHVCFLRAGKPGHLYMHVDHCWSMIASLWHNQVDTFVRDAVFSGASDFTSSESHKGITIVRMLEAARQMRHQYLGHTDTDLLRFTYDGKDGKRKRNMNTYTGTIEKASEQADWVMCYWHTMLLHSWCDAST